MGSDFRLVEGAPACSTSGSVPPSAAAVAKQLPLGAAPVVSTFSVVALLVVRALLGFIEKSGFTPFAYWRIFVGAIGLWGVLLFK